MSEIDVTAFDDLLRKGVSDTVPPEVEGRLRARLIDFRARLDTSETITRPGARPWVRSAWWGLGVACAAALVLLAVGPLAVGPRTTFAQVATATLNQPWIHVRTGFGGSVVGEEWVSPTQGIWASRHPRSIEYHDERLRVYDSYDPAEGAVYRGPAYGPPRGGEAESMVKAMLVLLQGERLPDQPLAQLDFLGPERARMKVMGQVVEKSRDMGRTWLDYRLTVQDARSSGPLRISFRVDGATRLPVSCRIEGQRNGWPADVELRFDYPEKGPADIYALGVPETARFVDRVPRGEIKRIVDTLQAGRERMDNYRAVFVKYLDLPGIWWWTERPAIFYRKGFRFRADYPCGFNGNLAATPRPAEGTELRRWWLDRTRFFRYYTMYLIRDSMMYTSDTRPVTDPDGSQHLEIASVQPTRFGLKPEEMVPVEWSMRPEFACRPPMGLGGPHFEPVLDMHPKDGPPGCILMGVRHTSTKDRINEKGIGIPDGYRYWLDPRRDYIVVRMMMVRRDAAGKEVIVSDDLIEETARSPQGVWYATRVRRKHVNRTDPKAKPIDEIYQIYVDFDADLPDSLFEPQTSGRVN